MTQYCRYCSLAVLNDDDLIYCEAKDEMREGKQIRNPNKCKHFEFNPVDVLDENKKYRPREPKKKNIEGAGELFINHWKPNLPRSDPTAAFART